MQLQTAQADDSEFIAELFGAAHVRDMVTPHTAAEVVHSIEDPNEIYLLAIAGDSRVGAALLAGVTNPNDSVELRKIAIGPVGKGHGRRFMELLLQYTFDDLAAHRLWLDVFPENDAARGLYDTLGFREDGVFRDLIKDGDTYRSTILMSILDSEYRAT